MPIPDLYDLPNNDVVFKQRHLLRKHQYRLVQDGVYVAENWLTGSTKYKVAFEDIPKEPSEVTVSSKGYLSLTIVLAAITIFTSAFLFLRQNVGPGIPLIWGVLSVLTGTLYFLSRQHFLVFGAPAGNEPLILYKDRPSCALLEQFLTRLQTRKKEYLRRTYLREDGLPLADAVRKLTWLKEQGIITGEEFEKLKAHSVGTGPWGSAHPSPN